MKLFASEFRRLLSRRLVRFVLLICLAGLALAAVLIFIQARRTQDQEPRPGEVRRVERMREREQRRCLRGDYGRLPEDPEEIEEFCSQDFIQVYDPRLRTTDALPVLGGLTVPLVIVLWLLGASYIGGEWHHGTITTLLTWEPRRLRLLGTKVAAVVLFGLIVSLIAQALVASILAGAASLYGVTEGADSEWFGELLIQGLRVAAMGGIATTMGFSLASIGRNTAAALGVGFAYLAIVENLLRALKPHWTPWFLSDNAVAFVSGGSVQVPGLGHSTGEATVVVLAYAAALLLAAAVLFKVRDVT